MFDRESQKLVEFFSNLIPNEGMSRMKRKIKAAVEFFRCTNEQTGSESLELMIESELIKNKSTLVLKGDTGKSAYSQAQGL